MRKVIRNDGSYYGIVLERGQYYVNLYNSENQEIDGFVITFDVEEDAYKAAQIAERSFKQGQQNIVDKIKGKFK